MRVLVTEIYRDWINGLKDHVVRARIQVRVDRLAHGNPGQHRKLTDGVSELKIDVGPGYHVYQGLLTLREASALPSRNGPNEARNEAGVGPRRGFATKWGPFLVATRRESTCWAGMLRCPARPGTGLGSAARLACRPSRHFRVASRSVNRPYTERHGELIVLLVGGDKSSQQQDIQAAIALARNLQEP
jgi:putative component of toxin-antitoxin plasmid stabilization module